jgi:hypothetical protein
MLLLLLPAPFHLGLSASSLVNSLSHSLESNNFLFRKKEREDDFMGKCSGIDFDDDEKFNIFFLHEIEATF